MTVLYRVDNRLVHGQIMSAWVPHLKAKRILIASDVVPTNDLQMQIFQMALPDDCGFEALPIQEAARWLEEKRHGRESTIVLFETIKDAAALFDVGHRFASLNIGNVHHAPGRECYTPAVYLGEDDLSTLRAMAARGMQIEIRSLPNETPTALRARLLEGV
jgi:PTS system mannose-specific IIB component